MVALWSFSSGARTATTRWICFRVPDSVPPLSAYLSKYTGAFIYWTLVGLYTSRQRVLRLIHVCSTLQPCIIHPVFEPRQYISTYQTIYSRQGVPLGFHIVTRSWDNWCIIIILTTSTVWLTSIFLPSSLHRLTSRRPSPSCTLPSLSPYHRFQPVLFYGIWTRGSCDNKSLCFISSKIFRIVSRVFLADLQHSIFNVFYLDIILVAPQLSSTVPFDFLSFLPMMIPSSLRKSLLTILLLRFASHRHVVNK